LRSPITKSFFAERWSANSCTAPVDQRAGIGVGRRDTERGDRDDPSLASASPSRGVGEHGDPGSVG
jgi:hypothetical protein